MVPTDKGLAIRGEGGWRVMDEQRGLHSAMTSAVLRDREGSLWVALIGAGVAAGWVTVNGKPGPRRKACRPT